jgi:hypothetical protein
MTATIEEGNILKWTCVFPGAVENEWEGWIVQS